MLSDFTLPLSFHYERTLPISDIFRNRNAEIILTSKTPIPLNVSIMTSRGLCFFDSVIICETDYSLPYEQSGGADWSVLQLQAQSPRDSCDSPFEVSMKGIFNIQESGKISKVKDLRIQ
jgi:hypothetical protein